MWGVEKFVDVERGVVEMRVRDVIDGGVRVCWVPPPLVYVCLNNETIYLTIVLGCWVTTLKMSMSRIPRK